MSDRVAELGRVTGGVQLQLPRARAYLSIIPEFRIYTETYPNWFWRFWQWLLLGWKWRRL